LAAKVNRTKPKSRQSADRPRVIIRPPAVQNGWAEQPGYAGHNNGIFNDAGYSSGHGLFGFQQDIRS
jgi:hypothetical protein